MTPGDQSAVATAELDPVCGMTVDPAKAAGSSTHEGKTYPARAYRQKDSG